MTDVFLRAQWRKLVMVNYAVKPEVLQPFLPWGTELDTWNETHYVSVVGFMFLDTKVLGIKIPFHVNFEEVNLRFYVKRKGANGEWKRGVVFIKEIVPKAAITTIANLLYKENYSTCSMRHAWEEHPEGIVAQYAWKDKNWQSMSVNATGPLLELEPDSEAEFITEHYWGYAKRNATQTTEYEVEHLPWQLWTVNEYELQIDFAQVYGSSFAALSEQKPVSVFLAEGSEIVVRKGNVIAKVE